MKLFPGGEYQLTHTTLSLLTPTPWADAQEKQHRCPLRACLVLPALPLGSPCELLPALVSHTVTFMCKRHHNPHGFTGADQADCDLLTPTAGQPGTCAFERDDAWCSSCPAQRDPALRQVPAEVLMLALMLLLTGSLQGSLWAIQGAGFFPPEVHQVAQFQASCALLLNYQEGKRKRCMWGFPNSQPTAPAGCPATNSPVAHTSLAESKPVTQGYAVTVQSPGRW